MKNITINTGNSKNTVFTVNELSHYIEHTSDTSLRLKLSKYSKKGYIENIARGMYTLPNREVNPFELANKIYSPSYISFFTALYHHGVIFQASPSDIYIAYKKTDIKDIKKLSIKIHQKFLKESILLEPEGLEYKQSYTIASAERAFLDTIYLYQNIYLDNLDILNEEKIKDLLPIYGREKMMLKRVKNYFPNFGLGMQ